MRISIKKMILDIRELTKRHPEAYVYAVILEASSAVANHAAAADPSLKEILTKYTDQTNLFLNRLEKEPLSQLDKGFFLHIQRPWNMINSAAQKQPKNERLGFLNGSTSFFWNAIAEEDKKAEAHKEGRRYGVFWIPFMLGASAIGAIFAYSSGNSTKEYIEEKEKEMSPIVYAGIGAIAVLGLSVLMRR